MPEYRTIVAPKPVVSKVEKYKRLKGLPSNSQALAAMTDEVEANDFLLRLFKLLAEKVVFLVGQLKDNPGEQSNSIISALMEMLVDISNQIAAKISPLRVR